MDGAASVNCCSWADATTVLIEVEPGGSTSTLHGCDVTTGTCEQVGELDLGVQHLSIADFRSCQGATDCRASGEVGHPRRGSAPSDRTRRQLPTRSTETAKSDSRVNGSRSHVENRCSSVRPAAAMSASKRL